MREQACCMRQTNAFGIVSEVCREEHSQLIMEHGECLRPLGCVTGPICPARTPFESTSASVIGFQRGLASILYLTWLDQCHSLLHCRVQGQTQNPVHCWGSDAAIFPLQVTRSWPSTA